MYKVWCCIYSRYSAHMWADVWTMAAYICAISSFELITTWW